ncbi:hypothetical protein Pan216_47810 [Planctomycetes bacterium Pan216]|uniref:FG-GAP repeat protein n=1 Tax=Kolteria novifilia TaxID=2527975 RepID=A0A518BA85_9BACT|nr:hypothetical protein Pan216_47810 [Planctomycetes bacterium Pan216]
MPLSLLASRAAGPLSSLKKFFADAARKSECPLDRFSAAAEVEGLGDRIVPANFSLNGTTLNVLLLPDESVTVSTIGNGASDNGGVLTLDGTTWSGSNTMDVVVGDGQVILGFDNSNDDMIISKVNIVGQGNNSVTLGETVANFDESLTVTLTDGKSITNPEAFAFDDGNDTLKVTATGVDVTQSGNGKLTLSGATTFDLGTTGDLILDSENNDTNAVDLSVIAANVELVDGDGSLALVESTISGNLDAKAVGSITDNGDVVVAGTTTVESTGGSITLDAAETKLVGAVNAKTDGGSVQLDTVTSDLIVGDVTTKTGNVILIGKNISQTGAIDTSNDDDTVFGDLYLSTPTVGNIILNNAENFVDGAKGGEVFIFSTGSTIFNSLDVFTKGDLDFQDNSGIQILTELSLGAEGGVANDNDNNGTALTVFGLTSITSGGEVDLFNNDNADNDFNELKVVQTDPDSPVAIKDKSSLVFWGSIAGELQVDVGNFLTLGGVFDLVLTEDKDALFDADLGIEILDFGVGLGAGESGFVVGNGAPVKVTSVDGTGILSVSEGGTAEIMDGIVVGSGSELKGDGTFDVGTSGVMIEEGGVVGAGDPYAESMSPENIQLDILGDLTFSPGGIIRDKIFTSDDVDLVNVSGTATITDTNLILFLDEAFAPQIGDSFVLLTADSVVGNFGNLNEDNQLIVDGVTFDIVIDATSVTATVSDVAPTAMIDGIGLYRPSAAEFVFNTSDVFNFVPDQFFTVGFGLVGDQGFIGDFTGDGIVNVAVYRDVSDTEPGFFIINTSPINAFDPAAFITTPFIGNGDEVPFAGDWDGDGDADLGLYRNADATYVTINLPEIAVGQTGEVALGTVRNIVFGNPSSVENPTDPPAVGRFLVNSVADQIGFGAQGTLDMANVDIATLPAGNSSITEFFNPDPFVFGTTGDQQLAGVFTEVSADGLDQRAIYRGETATFSISSGSQPNIVFGLVGDQGLTGNFVGLPLPVVPVTESLVDSFFEEEG